jgi:hypothetical protein
MPDPSPENLGTTRHSLHGLAELLLAGPQYRRSGTIRLRATPGGFGTVAEPPLRVDTTALVSGERRIPLAGMTYAQLAAAAGVDAGAPAGLYHDGSGAAPDDAVSVDEAAAAQIADSFAAADRALRALAPDQVPVLWPEHFDIGITIDEVNYGVSPGDGFCAEPYAYVGPHRPRVGPFWDAPFGAARPLRELPGDALTAYFAEGRDHARRDPAAG